MLHRAALLSTASGHGRYRRSSEEHSTVFQYRADHNADESLATVTIHRWEEFLTIRRRLRDPEHLLRIRFSVIQDVRNHVLAEFYRMNISSGQPFPGVGRLRTISETEACLFARSTVRSKKSEVSESLWAPSLTLYALYIRKSI